MDLIRVIIEYCINLVESGGLFIGFFLVFIECFIPALPLSVFVALNVNAFGFIFGCFISWIATSLGSILCYKLIRVLKDKLMNNNYFKNHFIKSRSRIEKFKNIRFSELVLILTLPFTPSFLINILSGVSSMSNKKFVGAILIGKFFSIIFWGYIGKSIISSITDIKSIVYIVSTLLLAYIISKIVSKKLNIE